MKVGVRENKDVDGGDGGVLFVKRRVISKEHCCDLKGDVFWKRQAINIQSVEV